MTETEGSKKKNKKKFHNNEPSKNTGHVKPVKHPFRLLMDSHMHIQSGACSTLPFLWEQIPGHPEWSRSTIQDWGTGKAAGTFKPNIKKLAIASAGNTYEVAKSFLPQAEAVRSEFRSKEPYDSAEDLLFCGAVMTMDMEYAHFGGYFGLKIYNPLYENEDDARNDKDPVAYWRPEPHTTGNVGKPGSSQVEGYPESGEAKSAFYERLYTGKNNDRIIGSLYDENGKRLHSIPIYCKVRDAPQEEITLYENWKTQLRRTRQATIKGKLRLLPMFHYDPRRWQHGDSEAFNAIGASGIFIGFKMYTAQGYRPWEPRLPHMAQFYATCEKEQIPILNHCTPNGASTYDRADYIRFTHPNDKPEVDGAQKEASKRKYYSQAGEIIDGKNIYPYPSSMIDNPPSGLTEYNKAKLGEMKEKREELATQLAAVDYFREYFVSPRAWRVVLQKHPDLRLCLAHFGDNSDMGQDWAKEIVSIMSEPPDHKDHKIKHKKKKYPNFYADIAYTFVDPGFRAFFKTLLLQHPHIIDNLLFGTDWFLMIGDGGAFDTYCRTAKEFFDAINKSYWPKISEENPCKFYRLGDQITRISNNIVIERQSLFAQEDARSKYNKTGKQKDDEKIMRDIALDDPKNAQDEIQKTALTIKKIAAKHAH